MSPARFPPHVLRYALGRICAVLAMQMQSVAVGWQLYERTGSAFALGLVGLVEVIPVLLLVLPAGHVADRFPRRNVLLAALAGQATASLALWAISSANAPTPLIYAALLAVGIANAFSSPANAALLPELVPQEQWLQANAWMSSAYELAAMIGPALAGGLIALTRTATATYALAAVANLLFVALLFTVPRGRAAHAGKAPSFRDLTAGLGFVFRTRPFLAAITLDLFAVLFGGATALLPIFAKDVLHAGPTGLGLLRTAPSLGAFTMAVVTTRLPPWKRPGRVLLATVSAFGLATIAFGLSRNLWLSFAALALAGLFDNVSVVIRSTLEQVVTPDALRGRVSAVNYVFIGFSNELGSLESGLAAAAFGPIAAVIGGGIATLLVVSAIAWRFPEVTALGPLHEIVPEPLEERAQRELKVG